MKVLHLPTKTTMTLNADKSAAACKGSDSDCHCEPMMAFDIGFPPVNLTKCCQRKMRITVSEYDDGDDECCLDHTNETATFGVLIPPNSNVVIELVDIDTNGEPICRHKLSFNSSAHHTAECDGGLTVRCVSHSVLTAVPVEA